MSTGNASNALPARVIRVSDVEPIQRPPDHSGLSYRDESQYWMSRKGAPAIHLLSYYGNQRVWKYSHAPFYGAFLNAYNFHQDVVLSPDDVWMRICLQFTKYVNKHAETLRPMLVAHDGKKKLTVETWLQKSESDWEEFFFLILDAIRSNTNPGVVDELQSNFSTTSGVERLLSTAVVMDTLKKFFDYGRCIPLCGIRNVVFLGTLEDWQRLPEKLQALHKYAVTSEWSAYINNLLPILDQFVRTYNGDVDRTFWDKVMNIEDGSIGSGSTTYVSGWILAFYGLRGRVDVSEIKDPFIDVPVELDNKITDVRKMVSIVGGFGGVSAVQGNGEAGGEGYDGYRPQMSFVVCTDGVDLNKLK